jgi:hypothetical protein
VSAGEKKKKRGRRGVGCCGKGELSVFFLFLFQTLFKTIFFQTKSNQNPSNFSQNFINLLDFTQATKNYAKPNNDAQTLVVSKLIKLN